MFFDPSLRTRVSFDTAITQLGGHCINIFADRDIYDLEPQDQVVMDGTAEEHVKDAARTLSRYVDALGIRQINHCGSWEDDRQEQRLFAGPLEDHDGMMGYPKTIEQEMVGFCAEQLLHYVPESVYFPCTLAN